MFNAVKIPHPLVGEESGNWELGIGNWETVFFLTITHYQSSITHYPFPIPEAAGRLSSPPTLVMGFPAAFYELLITNETPHLQYLAKAFQR